MSTAPSQPSPQSSRGVTWSSWVPIRPLRPRHRAKLLAHLLSLGVDDRYLRFGYHATDEQIAHYVDGLRFGHDVLLGIFDRRMRLIAVAHLALSTLPTDFQAAEFGVSVLSHARGRGYGGRLFARSLIHARNHGVTHLMVYALTENAPMIRIALRAGAHIERHGSESEALLRLPPADFDTQLRELVHDRVAMVDYHFKSSLYGWASFGALRRWWRTLGRWWRAR